MNPRLEFAVVKRLRTMEESLNGNCHDLVLVVMVLVLVLVVMNWCDHTNSCLQI